MHGITEGYNAKLPDEMNAYKAIDAFLKKNGFDRKEMPTAFPRNRRYVYWKGRMRVVVTSHYAGRDVSVEIPGIRTEAALSQQVLPDFIDKHLGPYVEGKVQDAPGINNKKPAIPMEENKNQASVVVEQIKFPSFNEFCKMNESVETEMQLYSEIASRVEQLKQVYGDKAINKTGIIKSLEAINRMILTAQKEQQPQTSSQPSEPAGQPFEQPQAQSQPFDMTQPQAQPQPQSQEQTQPQAQTQAQPQK